MVNGGNNNTNNTSINDSVVFSGSYLFKTANNGMRASELGLDFNVSLSLE